MIIVAVIIVLISSLVCYGLFKGKLNNVSGQLDSYESADYSLLYVMNYGDGFNNECLFPDTDIQFYLDVEKTHRLTVSGIMKEEGVTYTLEYLTPLNDLNVNEVCITQNTALQYKLKVGDMVFAEYPYSSDVVPTIIARIMGIEFDYENPIIDNNIGIIFIGYDEKYSSSTNGKYLLFASDSQVGILSVYPQIINTIINKSTNKDIVSAQGYAALIIGAVFSIAAVVLTQIVFFSKSSALLYRCYLKGMSKSQMILIPFLERIVFCLFPCALVQWIVTDALPECSIKTAYKTVPVAICFLYCLIMLVYDSVHLRKRGA